MELASVTPDASAAASDDATADCSSNDNKNIAANSISSNPFKKSDLGLKSVNMMQTANAVYTPIVTGNPLLVLAPAAQPKYEDSIKLPSSNNSSPTKLSMLDILRNFDSSEKQVHILFRTGGLPKGTAAKAKKIESIVLNSNAMPLNSHRHAASPVASIAAVKLEAAEATTVETKIDPIIQPRASITTRQQLKSLPASVAAQNILQKNADVDFTPRKLTRSNSLSARLAFFESKESDFLTSQELPLNHILKSETSDDIAKKGDCKKPTTPNSLPSIMPVTRSIITKSASVSELSHRFGDGKHLYSDSSDDAQETRVPEPSDKMTIKRSLSISRLAAKFEKSQPPKVEILEKVDISQSHEECQIIEQSPRVFADQDKEEKAEQLPMEPYPTASINLTMPEIRIESMFDENDGWMSSLLNNSVEFEESVKEIEKELELEKRNQANQGNCLENAVDAKADQPETIEASKIADPILKAISVTEIMENKPKPKKSVSFGVAWMGGLESIRSIPSNDDSTFVKPTGMTGRLLLKFTSIEDIIISTFGDERIIDFEISQGNQCATSPQYPITMFQQQASMDWECNLAITPGLPLHFTMKIREISNRQEKTSTLNRSQSTKISGITDGFKAFSSKIFGRTEENTVAEDPQMIHSGSCASFSSITSSGFQRDPIKGGASKAYQVRTGQFNVINLKEWLEPLSGVEKKTISFFQNDWDQPKPSFFAKSSEMVTLGKVQVQALYLQALNPMDLELLPESLTDYRNGVQLLNLHRRIWKDGFLMQIGGDCDIWRRRFFKLTGDCMVAHHETTMDPRATICLAQLETIEFLPSTESTGDENSFFFQFKDGRSIQFQAPNTGIRNEWIQAIEESHQILKSNSLPPWI